MALCNGLVQWPCAILMCGVELPALFLLPLFPAYLANYNLVFTIISILLVSSPSLFTLPNLLRKNTGRQSID